MKPHLVLFHSILIQIELEPNLSRSLTNPKLTHSPPPWNTSIVLYDSNRAALQYFKYKGQAVDKMIEQLDHTASLWSDVVKQAPLTQQTIVPLVKTWSVQISEQIETYGKEMATKLKDFKKRAFWEDNLTPEEAAKAMEEAEKALADETAELAKKTQLCATFDFPHLVSIVDHRTL